MPAGVGLLPFAEWGLGMQTAATVAGGAAASAIASKALAPKMRIPSLPTVSQAQVDTQSEQANQDAMRRQSIAGGVNSTILTGGQGAPLNNTVSNRTLLGA